MNKKMKKIKKTKSLTPWNTDRLNDLKENLTELVGIALKNKVTDDDINLIRTQLKQIHEVIGAIDSPSVGWNNIVEALTNFGIAIDQNTADNTQQTSDIQNNTDNIQAEALKLNAVIENAFQVLNKINKASSNPEIDVQNGWELGFNVQNGTNWNIANGILEWANTGRTDDFVSPTIPNGNQIWGLKLISGATIDGLFGLNGKLQFLFGNLSGNDGGKIVFRQYANETDFQAGTNQVGQDIQAGALALTDRLDNTQKGVDVVRTDLQSSAGEVWLVPLIIVEGSYGVTLLGKSDGYESFIEVVTSGSGSVGSLTSGSTTDNNLTNPTGGINPWKGLIDTNGTNITALQNDKLDKGLIGTTRTTRAEYNTLGEMLIKSYDNITQIGFVAKVKPDGIIVNNWDNNTGTATEYTQSEAGSLTSKKYVDAINDETELYNGVGQAIIDIGEPFTNYNEIYVEMTNEINNYIFPIIFKPTQTILTGNYHGVVTWSDNQNIASLILNDWTIKKVIGIGRK